MCVCASGVRVWAPVLQSSFFNLISDVKWLGESQGNTHDLMGSDRGAACAGDNAVNTLWEGGEKSMCDGGWPGSVQRTH